MSLADSIGFSSSSSKKKGSSPTYSSPSYKTSPVTLTPEQQLKRDIVNNKLDLQSQVAWSIILAIIVTCIELLMPHEYVYEHKDTKGNIIKPPTKYTNWWYIGFISLFSCLLGITLLAFIYSVIDYRKLNK